MNPENPYPNLLALDQASAVFIEKMLAITSEIENQSTNKKAKYRAYLKGVALQKEITAMVLGFKPIEDNLNFQNSIVKALGSYNREVQKDVIALIYQLGTNQKTIPSLEVE